MSKLHFAKATLFRLLARQPCRQFARSRVVRRSAGWRRTPSEDTSNGICDGTGNDDVILGGDDDILSGMAGDDTPRRGSGDDVLEGGAGTDEINGREDEGRGEFGWCPAAMLTPGCATARRTLHRGRG